MSDHADHSHDAHADHGHAHDHSAHDEHGGHDDHGHGDGHGEHWGDYNAQPKEPSTLPPIPAAGLAALGFALAILMGMIVSASLTLAESRESLEIDTKAHGAHGHEESSGKHGHEEKAPKHEH